MLSSLLNSHFSGSALSFKAFILLKSNAFPIPPWVERKQTNGCLTVRSAWHKATRASKMKMRLIFWDESSSPGTVFQSPQLHKAVSKPDAASRHVPWALCLGKWPAPRMGTDPFRFFFALAIGYLDNVH